MKSNEWYTPSKYIEAARATMGGIDLDPASCALANETVKAARYYTKEENGLMQPWHGRIWINPPFTGTNLRIQWVRRLIALYQEGYVEQAILLMPVAPDTRWFQSLWMFPICFPSSRIYFWQEKVHRENPNFGACLTYFGPSVERFIGHFQPFGPIVKAISQPAHKPLNLELFV